MEEHPGGEKAFRIGRVCTKRSARGHGHTTRLLQAALAEVGDYPAGSTRRPTWRRCTPSRIRP